MMEGWNDGIIGVILPNIPGAQPSSDPAFRRCPDVRRDGPWTSEELHVAKKPKLGKIFIVVFLTILIWVWSDLAQDETLPLPSFLTIRVARSNDPTLWVYFEGPDGIPRTAVTLDSVELTGPASRVTDVERMKNKGQLEAELYVAPEQEGLTEPGARPFDVLSFLKDSDEIRQLGLTVESCEPRNLTVQVRKLDEKSLAVQCLDHNGEPIPGASLNPARVTWYVPEDVTYTARIQLSEAEQRQARGAPVQKRPYVDLAPGQRREIDTPVTVTLPREEVALAEYPVPANVGFIFSLNLQGQYRVELDPQQPELTGVSVRATPAALDAYRLETFKTLLYILDEDRQREDWIERRVEFNFPQQYVRSGQIEEGESPPPIVRFRLVPITEEIRETP